MLLTQAPKKSFRRDAAEDANFVVSSFRDAPAPDAVVAAQVRQQFEQLGYAQIQNLRIDVQHGNVALSGKLNRYYLRQLAQAAALRVGGVMKLTMAIDVVPAAGSDEALAD